MAKSDSRSSSGSNTPSISAPRRLNSLAVKPPAVFQKKRSLPDDCTFNVDRVRQRTDSVSSTTSTIVDVRTHSRIKSLISSATSLRRNSSEESRPDSTRQRTISSNSNPAVEFPKAAASQSLIPVRSPSAAGTNRKRLLSRNDEEEAQPRVRQRLQSNASVQTAKGVAISEPTPITENKPVKERKRLDSMRNSASRLSTLLDPGRADIAKAAVSAANAVETKRSNSLRRKPAFGSTDEGKTRKPFGQTQTPNTEHSNTSDLESVVNELMANEGVALSFDNTPMCIDDLEEIPDLPLSRPSSVAQSANHTAVKSNLERFDVKIVCQKNTEVWDTVQDDVYAFEGSLCVRDNDLKKVWEDMPPVESINLECRARDPPVSPNSSLSSSTSAAADYHTTYQGQSLHEIEVLRSMDYTKGISVNKKWERHYSYQDPTKADWKLRFWVPIPMKMFNKLQDRQFKLRAKVTFSDPSSGGMKVVAHAGSVDMSISSLKTADFVRSP